jgi:putative photosynthetic complex assembly protein 2
MSDYLTPGLHALFIWWFSTGIVFWLDRRPQRVFAPVMLAATLLLGVAFAAIAVSSDDTSVTGAYYAFTAALGVWVWIELSFYLGYITGIRRHACEPGCAGWRHFGHAIQASLWHEIAILACLAVIVGLTWGRGNEVALWTFAVLKWMHQSARLNVFLGVRNIRTDLLPPHLDFLKSFFRRRRMNALFPFSMTLSLIATVLIFRAAGADDASAFTRTGLAFVGALMVLAILEHVVLMLPLPIEAIWAWWLGPQAAPAVTTSSRPTRRARPAGANRHGAPSHLGVPTDQKERRRP